MKSAYLKVVCILSCIFLLCVATVHGGCLADADTSHTSADYNQRLFSYTSKQPVQPSNSNDLKFMTFNLQSGYHYNCVNNVTIQADFMRGMDYVGNQEVVQGVDTRCNRCNIPQTIADRAGMATRFVMAIPYRTGQYGTNVGTSQTILDTKWGLLSYSGVEARGIIAVKTQPLALKGKYLWFVNIHIEYYVDTIRYSQMADILTFINTNILAYDSEAVIVMVGDFNGGPWDTNVYNVLKAASFKNTWEVFSGTIEGGNTISAYNPGSRFDHIWYRAPTSVKVTVKNAEVPAVLLSDHRPVVATLSFDVASASSSSSSSSGSTSTSGSTSSSGGNNGGCAPAPEAAPAASIVCVGPITEGNAVTIRCPVASQTIASVEFASYGNPTGSCQNFKLGNCVGGASMAVTKDKCLNKSSCTFPIANNVFGDPCPGNGKHFVAQVTCK